MSIHAIRRYWVITTVLACITFPLHADQPATLVQSAHVCTDESETQRLAINDQLREMAKALAEFKPTTFCFIMQPSLAVLVLEKGETYVKFSHDSKVMYTFPEYIHADDTANVMAGLADNTL
ncbi:hypothetical protein SAMN06297280_0027 [Arsukibacterium tuosuense]|uniref:Uncharacterized protein n=1 Tax=Arsukibacterium tuosuense TaxID=1323745 RepID=A0A285JM51_9GAMM|nr:hypothetical protein [Arsukibacterium tuosuense]SNY60181.1 hypothetical protein SAMN06297280_0027 [Arsukibacterium tuosuense]